MWLIFLLLLPAPSSAEVSDKEIMNHILRSFPGLEMARDDVRIAEGEQLFAEGGFDIVLQAEAAKMMGNYEYEFLQSKIVKPTSLFGLDLYAGFRKSDGTIPLYYGELETLSKGELSVGARLPLLRGFLIDERRALLKKNELLVEQRQMQLRAAELDQIRASMHRYWDWRLALQKVSIYKNLLDIALKRDEWLTKRTKLGDIARFERDDNQRSILARQSTLLMSEQSLRHTLSELEYFIDDLQLRSQLESTMATKTEFPLPQGIAALYNAPETLVKVAYENRPELKSFALQKNQLQIDDELQSNRFWPKLDLAAEHSKDRGVSPLSSLGDDNTKISIQLEVPLQYRRLRGRAEQIDGSISRLKNQTLLLEQRIRSDILTSQKNLQIALKRRELATQELELAQKLEAGERLRLRQGETNILMVNLREQATAEAELRHAEASTEALKHYITLKTTIGELPNK